VNPEPPTEYELAKEEASRALGRSLFKVYCFHGKAVGEVRDSPHGAVFCADVPIEAGSGAALILERMSSEAGRRLPPFIYRFRFLIEHPGEATDLPMMSCKQCGGAVPVDWLREQMHRYRSGKKLEKVLPFPHSG
jgi:hypothetical protein